jgi:hypothetical protein
MPIPSGRPGRGGLRAGQVLAQVGVGGDVGAAGAGRPAGADEGADAGTDLDDFAAAGLDQPDALGDIKGLADGVGVPGGADAGAEADGVDPHA